jgi:hypothetical protein
VVVYVTFSDPYVSWDAMMRNIGILGQMARHALRVAGEIGEKEGLVP